MSSGWLTMTSTHSRILTLSISTSTNMFKEGSSKAATEIKSSIIFVKNINMSECVYLCVCVYIYTDINLYLYIYVCMHLCVCVYIYIQARILEWASISFFRGSFQPRHWASLHWQMGSLPLAPPRKPYVQSQIDRHISLNINRIKLFR